MSDTSAEMAGLAPRALGRPRASDPEAERQTVPALVMLGLLFGMARRRKAALLSVALLVPFCAFVALAQITPRYTASGFVLYDPSGYAARELQSILRTDPATDSVMTSQVEIVQGLRMAERLADRF